MSFFTGRLGLLATARITSSKVNAPTDNGNTIHGTKPEASGKLVIPLFGPSDVPAIGDTETLEDAGGVTDTVPVG